MEPADEILKFLQFSAQLKNQTRSIKLSDSRYESVADHSWHLALMVLLVYPHLEIKVDLLKALKMAIVHDIVEAEIGDISYTLDSAVQKEKHQRERQEMEKIKGLVSEGLGGEIYDLWHEYEEKISGEARLIKALDSLEANYQSILYEVDYWDDWFYNIALTKADAHCRHEHILSELNCAITHQMEHVFKKAGLDLEKIKGNKL